MITAEMAYLDSSTYGINIHKCLTRLMWRNKKKVVNIKYKFAYYHHPHVCVSVDGKHIGDEHIGWTMNMSTKMWLIWYYVK